MILQVGLLDAVMLIHHQFGDFQLEGGTKELAFGHVAICITSIRAVQV